MTTNSQPMDALNALIKGINEDIKKYGYFSVATCNHYNWDRQKHALMHQLKTDMFNIVREVNWGVTDWFITSNITRIQ